MDGRCEDGGGEGSERSVRVQTVPRQRSRAHTRARYIPHPVSMYVYVHTYACTRDCIYAESYLPRLKSHRAGIPWQRCLGNSLRARSHFQDPVALSLPIPPSLSPPTRPPLPSPAPSPPSAVPRNIGTPPSYADASLAFLRKDVARQRRAFIIPSFFLRRDAPPSVTPARGDLTDGRAEYEITYS